MSKHWRPDEKIVRIRPVGDWARLHGQSHGPATRRPLSDGAKAGLVLVAAACLGAAIGIYHAFGPLQVVAPGAESQWNAGPAETMIPDVQAEATDAEWQGRAEGLDRPSAPSARAVGAVVRFSHCHVGGGTNCVVDGDTFYLAGAKVRIAGIDAPETHPPRCAREARLGSQATETLQALLNSGAVTMTGIGRDRDTYGRLLRNVAVNGQDVGHAMIAAGVAREYKRGRRGWC